MVFQKLKKLVILHTELNGRTLQAFAQMVEERQRDGGVGDKLKVNRRLTFSSAVE